ncbi:MAG: hypothetical protein L6R38_009164 [Xanthoria sp. 2 TBL-2021]|nr:MAG: hypothetical protein L6R38_009164 [Xanthoria sp. 2 TBL-2021]
MAVACASKRRRISPPESPSSTEPLAPDGHVYKASGWNLEQQYEQRPREQKKVLESTRLPIKTAEGRIERLASPESEQETVDSLFGSGDEDASDTQETEVEERPVEIPIRQQIIEAKEELARIGTLLSENPEEHIGGFRKIAEIGASTNTVVKKLALATQLAVYKDIIPGYRIRPLGELDSSEKVSKEVRKLRSFEQALVTNYQNYIKEVAKCAKASGDSSSEDRASIATVAISCACTLLLAVPHFNLRSELIKILVDKLSTRNRDDDFIKCIETLEKLFREDDDGNPSLDGVTQLSKLIKARDYRIDESVLNTFLHLRLLSEFSSRGSQNRIDKPASTDAKKSKFKKEFRTKKYRKILKERKAVEKEFKEADAIVSHEERDRLQAETLKIVFVTYFRILKTRVPNLTGAVLEGLAKYAHLINQDFFGDLLETLKDLISKASFEDPTQDTEDDTLDAPENPASQHDPLRSTLLSTTTAFTLLEGQDAARSASALHLDLSFFTTHLYKTLHSFALNPDIELSSKSLRLPDPHDPSSHHNLSQPITTNNKVNLKTPSVLLLRALSSILVPRSVPPLRVAAFVKQLYICSLQLPEKSAQAVLGLLHQVMKLHGRKVAALWNTEERKGDGVFDALRGDVEGSNPFASTIWEGELLRCHYVPAVREGLKGIERLVREIK